MKINLNTETHIILAKAELQERLYKQYNDGYECGFNKGRTYNYNSDDNLIFPEKEGTLDFDKQQVIGGW